MLDTTPIVYYQGPIAYKSPVASALLQDPHPQQSGAGLVNAPFSAHRLWRLVCP